MIQVDSQFKLNLYINISIKKKKMDMNDTVTNIETS